jgi:hypothetical protein
MPLLGAPPVNQAFHFLAGNRAALPGAIYLMIVKGGPRRLRPDGARDDVLGP